MMNVAQRATHAPIQAQRSPIRVANAPIGPRRAAFPIANSTRSSGTLHVSRKIAHGIRNVPPPLVAAIRGKRQMLPVPTAIPSMTSSIPYRFENVLGPSDALMEHLHQGSEAQGLHAEPLAGELLDPALLPQRPQLRQERPAARVQEPVLVVPVAKRGVNRPGEHPGPQVADAVEVRIDVLDPELARSARPRRARQARRVLVRACGAGAFTMQRTLVRELGRVAAQGR